MAAEPIDPATTVGPVRLLVADLARVREYYERAIGLRALAGDGEAVALGVEDGVPLVELVARPAAPPRPRGGSGLFHLALLLPSRAQLAAALRRLAQARAPLSGASDHLVSEALYVADPEGNGIELYRDRPREEWRRDERGELRMATLPLDLDDLLSAAPDGERAQAPAGTRVGHVHLQVADLDPAEAFYAGLLGFEVMVRGYPGALFVAAGGYHHHIGLNTWASAGGPPNALGARGLERFEIALPTGTELERVARRLEQAGTPAQALDGGVLARDPFGNGVLLRATPPDVG